MVHQNQCSKKRRKGPTFFSKSFPLMGLKVISSALPHHSRITPCLRIIQYHGFFEQLEAIDLFYSASRRVNVVKDNKSLAFRAQVRFCDDL